MITTSLVLALMSHCEPLLGLLERNQDIDSAWLRESNCLREVREGRAPSVLEALAESKSDTAALLRCELRLSPEAFEHGLTSTNDVVLARCLINAAIAYPSTLTRAAIEAVTEAALRDAISTVSADEFVLLGPLLEVADLANLEWRARLFALVCDRFIKSAATCAEYAQKDPYRLVVAQRERAKAQFEARQAEAAANDLGDKFARTALVLTVDALLLTTTVLLRDHPLAGQISASVSATLGLAPLGALLGGLIGSATERLAFVVYGVVIGRAVGAVTGGLLGALLTPTPGPSRPLAAGAALGVGTAVLIPFIWIF